MCAHGDWSSRGDGAARATCAMGLVSAYGAGTPCFTCRLEQRLGEARAQVVVGAHELDVVSPGDVEPGVPCGAKPPVLPMDDAEAPVFACPLVAHCAPAVREAVVHDDDLNADVCLCGDAGKALVQIGFHVVNRHDDGDRGSVRFWVAGRCGDVAGVFMRAMVADGETRGRRV